MGRVNVSREYSRTRDRILEGILHGDQRAGRTGSAILVPVTYTEPPLAIPLHFLASELTQATAYRAAAWGVDLAFVAFDRPDQFADRFRLFRSGPREHVFDGATKPSLYLAALRAFAGVA
jgi:hypothetical protein